jgi:predicted nucleotidyltransferase
MYEIRFSTAAIIPYCAKRVEMEEALKGQILEALRTLPYRFLLLFGSYAKGSVHTFSDVDLGICHSEPLSLETLGYHTAKLESALKRPVDLLDLHRLPERAPLLAFEILSHHTPLDIRDEKAYVDFKRRAQLYYLDHKPLIEANRAQLLRRLEEGKTGERDYA